MEVFDKKTGEVFEVAPVRPPFRTQFQTFDMKPEENSGVSDVDEAGYMDIQELYLRTLRRELLPPRLIYDENTDTGKSDEDALLDAAQRPIDDMADAMTRVDELFPPSDKADADLSTQEGVSETSSNSGASAAAVGKSEASDEEAAKE